MKRVTIYLRSVEQKGEKHLAMFDSNRNGAIDILKTEVQAGATIIWKLDCFSGIRSITKIYSKEGENVMYLKTIREKDCYAKDLSFNYQMMQKEKKHTPLITSIGIKQK